MKNITHYKGTKIWWYKDCFQVYIAKFWSISYWHEDMHDPEIFNHQLQIGKIVFAW